MVEGPPPRPQPRRFDEDGDASRRTWLASERTVLAWLRTGLTATAVALGVVVVGYGLWRGHEVDRAIRQGRWVSPDTRAMAFVGGLSIALGLLTALVIVADA